MSSQSPPLETRQSSASLRGEKTGMRQLPVVSKYIDTSTCIGCKACEVACQEWNDLETVPTQQVGSYQTLPTLNASFWNLIKFREQDLPGGDLAWLMRKDQCMHCADPGCLRACPAPGAIVQYENGIVDVNADACIGCGLCATGCPFDVPRFHARTGKMAKCTLCVDRVTVGLEPACIKACPTGCLQFGTKEDMLRVGAERVQQLKETGFVNAALYDPSGVGGTGVVTVLAHGDHPEWYQLPADPQVPLSVRIVKSLLRPLGLVAMFGTIGASFGHFLRYGPKEPGSADGPRVSAPRARVAAENTVVKGHLVRHGLGARVIHWLVALAFFVTLLTGLPIWTPIFRWLAPLFGGLHVCRWLHPWAGVALVGAGVLMFFRWLGEMRMEKGDWGWLGPKLVAYFRQEQEQDDEGEDTGKYNGGQKILFFAVSILTLALLVTGVVLWFPLSFAQGLREASWVIHDGAFLFFAVTIVVHIYLGTAALPGTFQSMTRGTVSKAWARLHHPRWYRESTDETPGVEDRGGRR